MSKLGFESETAKKLCDVIHVRDIGRRIIVLLCECHPYRLPGEQLFRIRKHAFEEVQRLPRIDVEALVQILRSARFPLYMSPMPEGRCHVATEHRPRRRLLRYRT